MLSGEAGINEVDVVKLKKSILLLEQHVITLTGYLSLDPFNPDLNTQLRITSLSLVRESQLLRIQPDS